MIEQLFSPQMVQALGWTLVHTLWQGALFALLTGILLVALRKFSAQARYVVTVGMLAVFFITVLFTFGRQYEKPLGPVQISESSRGVAPAEEVDLRTVLADQITKAQGASEQALSESPPPVERFQQRMVRYFDQHLPLIVTLWLMGVLILQLRFLGQLAFIQRLKNYGASRFPAEWAGRIQVLEEQNETLRNSVSKVFSMQKGRNPPKVAWEKVRIGVEVLLKWFGESKALKES